MVSSSDIDSFDLGFDFALAGLDLDESNSDVGSALALYSNNWVVGFHLDRNLDFPQSVDLALGIFSLSWGFARDFDLAVVVSNSEIGSSSAFLDPDIDFPEVVADTAADLDLNLDFEVHFQDMHLHTVFSMIRLSSF